MHFIVFRLNLHSEFGPEFAHWANLQKIAAKMAIHYEYSVEVNSSPEQAFAVIDELARTPEWLCVCVSLEKLTQGPNKVGDKLMTPLIRLGVPKQTKDAMHALRAILDSAVRTV